MVTDGQECYVQGKISCNETNVEAVCQFYRYGQTSEGLYMQIYNLFGFFWGLFFLEALDQMVLAGAFASWYWVLNKKDVPKLPLMSSFSRTCRYHIGTLAFGSLIIAILRMIRVMIEYIEEKLKEYHQDNPLVKVNLKKNHRNFLFAFSNVILTSQSITIFSVCFASANAVSTV